jgi:hypothetical protein
MLDKSKFRRTLPPLPPPMRINGRALYRDSAVAHAINCLEARARGLPDPEYTPRPDDVLINATEVARRLGVSRRTIGLYMKMNEKQAAEQ